MTSDRTHGLGDVDQTVPNVARMYDYFLGGFRNFAVDREAAEKLLAVFPDTPVAARTNRRFLRRAVRYLVDAGVRQFLDIGAGLPTEGSVHEVATDARVVYVDADPVAVAHARTLTEDLDRVAVAQADLREPDALLRSPEVRRLLDLTEPVAVLLVSVLHFVPDTADPGALVAGLRDACAPGSHLVLSHLTADGVDRTRVERGRQVYQRANAPLVPRARTEILRFFDGYELVEPGLVWLDDWRPEVASASGVSHGYGGVGLRP